MNCGRMPIDADADNTSLDSVLGGKLVLRQPLHGHRFGHDAILLAAAANAHAGEQAVDLGAGVGAAGLALARRIKPLSVTLVEIDPALAALAQDNIARNGFAERVRAVCLDIAAPAAAFAAAGLMPGLADCVLMNPPFNPPHNPPPDHGRRMARVAANGGLRTWLRAAARLLKPSGTLTLIWRADGFNGVLTELAHGFGAVSVMPIHPKPATPAIRVLLRAAKKGSVALTLLPGLVLADADGKPSRAAEAVLRDGAALPFP